MTAAHRHDDNTHNFTAATTLPGRQCFAALDTARRFSEYRLDGAHGVWRDLYGSRKACSKQMLLCGDWAGRWNVGYVYAEQLDTVSRGRRLCSGYSSRWDLWSGLLLQACVLLEADEVPQWLTPLLTYSPQTLDCIDTLYLLSKSHHRLPCFQAPTCRFYCRTIQIAISFDFVELDPVMACFPS